MAAKKTAKIDGLNINFPGKTYPLDANRSRACVADTAAQGLIIEQGEREWSGI